MRLRLDRLFENPGASLPVEESFAPDWDDLSPFSLTEPISLVGRVENKAGVVTARLQLSSNMTALCDRCLESVSIPVSLQVETTLVRSLANEDEEEHFLVLPDACLDTQDLARNELILNLPTRVLCSEECRGLCPACGCNRNQTECGCFDDEEQNL